MNFKQEIIDLIHKKSEGAYWDFKKKWYVLNGAKKSEPEKEGKQPSNDVIKSEFLHDIISMANNLENRDAYIIIGVENKSCRIEGVEQDENRKNTQQLCDFLRDKKFAGGVRPQVYVNEIKVGKKILDVIVIKNSLNTPYYLIEKFGKLLPFHIYTRVQDTNTSADGSADYDKVEYLWKKRFGLLQFPADKFYIMTKDSESWEKSKIDFEDSYLEIWFNKLYPEYTIKLKKDDRTGSEPYMDSFCDKTPHWGEVYLFYHQTLLDAFSCVFLDGCRYTVLAPNITPIENEDSQVKKRLIYYYVKNDLRYTLSNILLSENPDNKKSLESIVELKDKICFFESDEEKKGFIEYAKKRNFCFSAPSLLKRYRNIIS